MSDASVEVSDIALANMQAALGRAGIVVLDVEGRIVHVDDVAARWYGVPAVDLVGKRHEDVVDVARSTAFLGHIADALEDGLPRLRSETVAMLHGGDRALWFGLAPVWGPGLSKQGLYAIVGDLTVPGDSEALLSARADDVSLVLESIYPHVYIKDDDGRYLFANQEVLAMFGRPLEDVIGHTDQHVLPREVADRVMHLDALVLNARSRQAREETIVDHKGRERRFWTIRFVVEPPDSPPVLVGISSEITQVLQLQNDLSRTLRFDPQTRLANSIQFVDDVDGLVDRSVPGQVSVVRLELDRFRHLDPLPGDAGSDDVLREIASRLSRVADERGFDYVARLGSDEFGVAFVRRTAAERDAAVADLLRVITNPVDLDGRLLRLSVTAGVVTTTYEHAGGAVLVARAAEAMYDARGHRSDRSRVWSPEIHAAVAERIAIEHDLHVALTGGQFELDYQPKVDREQRLTGVEALIRWNRPGHGRVSPLTFISLAEELGLLGRIGDWVLDEACAQMARWYAAGLGWVPVAVNLSPAHLATPGLAPRIASLIDLHGIPQGALGIEITESAVMDEPEVVNENLRRIAAQGVRIAIDDFGTGYSSLAYLRDLPVDALKLDRGFVRDVATDQRDAELCSAVITMAHKLGLHVVAEGVETKEQFDRLVAAECDVSRASC